MARKEALRLTAESPTWGHVQRMAEAVLAKLGGHRGAADSLSGESFYTLTVLASLRLDTQKAGAFIFATQYLS